MRRSFDTSIQIDHGPNCPLPTTSALPLSSAAIRTRLAPHSPESPTRHEWTVMTIYMCPVARSTTTTMRATPTNPLGP